MARGRRHQSAAGSGGNLPASDGERAGIVYQETKPSVRESDMSKEEGDEEDLLVWQRRLFVEDGLDDGALAAGPRPLNALGELDEPSAAQSLGCLLKDLDMGEGNIEAHSTQLPLGVPEQPPVRPPPPPALLVPLAPQGVSWPAATLPPPGLLEDAAAILALPSRPNAPQGVSWPAAALPPPGLLDDAAAISALPSRPNAPQGVSWPSATLPPPGLLDDAAAAISAASLPASATVAQHVHHHHHYYHQFPVPYPGLVASTCAPTCFVPAATAALWGPIYTQTEEPPMLCVPPGLTPNVTEPSPIAAAVTTTTSTELAAAEAAGGGGTSLFGVSDGFCNKTGSVSSTAHRAAESRLVVGNGNRGRSSKVGPGGTGGNRGSSSASGATRSGAEGSGSVGVSQGRSAVAPMGRALVNAQQSQQRVSRRGADQSNFRRNKWINRQVTKSADAGNVQKLLQTIETHMSEMNSINLATALHRVTKLVVAGNSGLSVSSLLKHPTFLQLKGTVLQCVERQKQLVESEGRGETMATDGGSGQCSGTEELQDVSAQTRRPTPSQPAIFEVQCMSIVTWSFATLRHHEAQLMTTIVDVALPRLEELKPYELSNMIWAFAKLSVGPLALYTAVSELMAKRTPGVFGTQCLSMIAWCYATAKHKDAALFTSIAREISEKATLAKPQEVANTLWAYAKNRCYEVALFDSLGDMVVEHNLLWDFKPQELSNTLWAFATIGHHHAGIFREAIVVAVSKRYQLSPQNIANILWAYAKVEASKRSLLFPALLGVSVGMMPKHKPKEISAIAWAATKENYPACRQFFGATAQLCAERLHEFPPEALANMVEAFALMDVDTMEFSEAMTCESIGRLHQFEPTTLANLFRGVVLMAKRMHMVASSSGGVASAPEIRERHLLASIGTHIAARIDNLQDVDLAHVEHSLQILGPNLLEYTGGLDKVFPRSGQHAADDPEHLSTDIDAAPVVTPQQLAPSFTTLESSIAHESTSNPASGQGALDWTASSPFGSLVWPAGSQYPAVAWGSFGAGGGAAPLNLGLWPVDASG